MNNRPPYQNSKQWQELMIRNQKLAMEVTRLQEQNRFLRRRIQSLAVDHLHLEKRSVEKGSQTEESDHTFISPNLPQHFEIETNLVETSTSPDFICVEKSEVQQRRRSHIRKTAMSKLDFDLLEESSEFLDVKISAPENIEYRANTPRRRSSLRRRTSRQFVEEPVTPPLSAKSPCQKRVSDTLAQKVLSPHDVGSDTLDAFSPVRRTSDRDTYSPFTPTMSMDASIARTPRSVKKPVSYQEPSLRAKVRKGFKFFTFA